MFHKQLSYHSVFFRLICLLLVCFVPVFSGIFLAIDASMVEMREETMATMERQLSAQMTKLEDEVTRIVMAQLSVITSDSDVVQLIKRYGRMGAYELGENVFRIHQKLTYLSNLSTLIRSVGIYMPQISRELTTELYYIDEISQQTQNLYQSACTQRQRSVFLMDHLYFAIAQPPSAYDRNPNYIIYAKLDQAKMDDFIQATGSEYAFRVFSALDAPSFQDTPFAGLPASQLAAMVGQSPANLVHDSQSYIGALRYSDWLNCYLASYSIQSAASVHYQRNAIALIAIGVMLLIGFVLMIYYYYLTVKKPLILLLDGFTRVEEGDLDTRIASDGKNEFSMLVNYFNQMVEKLKNMISEVYVKDLSLKQAELKRLQAQISPHFLYNSFSIISHAIHIENTECAQKMTKLLADYLKYITRNTEQTEKLIHEVDFARVYAQIQDIRFDGRVRVHFDPLPEEYVDLKVPKMMIQPLIENAYKHGFRNCEEGGQVQVGFEQATDGLTITVRDNGEGLSPAALLQLQHQLQRGELIDHDGLSNVHQRLTMLYPGNLGLRLDAEEGKHFTVSFTIPKGGSNVQPDDRR